MTFSIITASYNCESTIRDTIESVNKQTIKPIEHIIIDGKSTDNTLQILKSYSHLTIISEPDNGIYDALNKGINLAQGEIIGFLHSDDFYADHLVLESVLNIFQQNQCDALYGDLEYVSPKNINKVVRFWKAGQYNQKKIKKGWMPPHPTLFVKKSIYESFGNFDLNYSIAADYELIVRFLWKFNLNVCYLPKVLVKMRYGGKSNRLNNIFLKMKEDYQVIKKYKLGGPHVLLFKNIQKIVQFF